MHASTTRYLAIAILGIAALIAPAAENDPKVTVAYAANVLALPLFVAQEIGGFEKYGVVVELQRHETANVMVAAVAGGSADIATGVSLLPVLNLEAQSPGRVHLLLHSRMSDRAPFDSIVVREDSNIRNLADLVGKKVATYPGTTAPALLAEYLRRNKVDPAAMEFVALPGNAHANALNAGVIAGAFAYEPVVSALLQAGKARRLTGSIYSALQQGESPISVTVVSRNAERNKAEAVQRFIAALEEAILLIRKDPATARKSLPKMISLAPEVAAVVPLMEDATRAEVNPTSVQAFIDMMIGLGECPAGVKAANLLSPTTP